MDPLATCDHIILWVDPHAIECGQGGQHRGCSGYYRGWANLRIDHRHTSSGVRGQGGRGGHSSIPFRSPLVEAKELWLGVQLAIKAEPALWGIK